MNFKEIDIFSKEFKKMLKKYSTLEQDLDNFKNNVGEVDLCGNKNFVVLIRKSKLSIVKARFFCRYLKRRSLRIIYSYDNQNNLIEFIELYSKSEKSREDQERIKNYLKNV